MCNLQTYRILGKPIYARPTIQQRKYDYIHRNFTVCYNSKIILLKTNLIEYKVYMSHNIPTASTRVTSIIEPVYIPT